MENLLTPAILLLIIIGCYVVAWCMRDTKDLETDTDDQNDEDADYEAVQVEQQTQLYGGSRLLCGQIVVYASHGGDLNSSSSTDCAICLEGFKDGDSCKVLPGCNHMYHPNCIDQWLIMNEHCPICRGSVHGSNQDDRPDYQSQV